MRNILAEQLIRLLDRTFALMSVVRWIRRLKDNVFIGRAFSVDMQSLNKSVFSGNRHGALLAWSSVGIRALLSIEWRPMVAVI